MTLLGNVCGCSRSCVRIPCRCFSAGVSDVIKNNRKGYQPVTSGGRIVPLCVKIKRVAVWSLVQSHSMRDRYSPDHMIQFVVFDDTVHIHSR